MLFITDLCWMCSHRWLQGLPQPIDCSHVWVTRSSLSNEADPKPQKKPDDEGLWYRDPAKVWSTAYHLSSQLLHRLERRVRSFTAAKARDQDEAAGKQASCCWEPGREPPSKCSQIWLQLICCKGACFPLAGQHNSGILPSCECGTAYIGMALQNIPVGNMNM